MYYGNQIIWDLDKKELVQLSNPDSTFAWIGDQYPKRHTHLVWTDKASKDMRGRIYCNEGGIVGAEYFLEKGKIAPSKEA